ncbi:MAG: cytochrome c biogenesis protein CcdA [Proteobacteria bacterium]|nr:cytochrome c biogenesis protein CcdA [Pseudomonadota bacterium]
MLVLFLAGMLSALSPCVLPLIPIVTIASIEKSLQSFFLLIAGFVFSFSMAGTLLGILSAESFIDPNILRIWGAWLMVLMGIFMLNSKFNILFQNFLSKIQNHKIKVPQVLLKSDFIKGLSLGLIWGPCIGPSLGAALGYLAREGSQFRGFIHVTLFGVGAGSSLALLGFLSHKLGFQWFHKQKSRLRKLYIVGALAVIVVGFLVIMAWDKRIEAFLTSHLPEWWQNIIVKF